MASINVNVDWRFSAIATLIMQAALCGSIAINNANQSQAINDAIRAIEVSSAAMKAETDEIKKLADKLGARHGQTGAAP